jgi:hypothetical protein
MSRLNDDDWRRRLEATEDLEALTVPQLKEHLRYFNDARGTVELMTDHIPTGKKETCEERINHLRKR